MRIYGPSQAEAQTLADRAHAYLIATDPAYADSVRCGFTTRWAVPARDVDADGHPAGDWFIPVEPRVLDAFSAAQQNTLDAEGQAALAARLPL